MKIDILLNEFASPHEAAELGLLAESYGVRGVWSSNYPDSRDPFFALALLAERSSTIRMGTMAISPAELHPLKMANLLLSLNELSGGRGMIMVGGGGGVLQAIGGKRERLLRSVRECLEILKGASPEETMNYGGELYQVRGYRPAYATDPAPLVYYGANHPQSRRVATKLADGVITSDFVVPLMRDYVDAARAELAEAGRSPEEFHIGNVFAWHIKEDAEASRREARREMMLRGWLHAYYFEPFLDADEIAVMCDHEQDFMNAFRRRTHVIENVPDELVDKMVDNISFAGGLDRIEATIDTLRAFADAGVTETTLRVHDDPADAIRLIGERVIPKL